MARIAVIASLTKSLVIFRGELLKALIARGHQVVACAPDADQAAERELAAIGVDFRRVPVKRTGMNPLADIAYAFQLYKMLRAEKVDYFFAYTIKPIVYGSLAARLAGISNRAAMVTGLGYTFSGTSFRRALLNRLVRQLYRLSLKGCAVVLFQNPDDKAVFEQLQLLDRGTKVVVVDGSGVDLEKFARPEEDAADGEPVRRFLLIARLLAEKGIREYVEAARVIKANHPDCEFHLVGWIDENPNAISRSELEAWIADGLVHYHGAVDDVRPYLRQCQVYVLPSYYAEGTPRTVLEALAMGKPVITTDWPGCRETVIDGENGYLIPPRSAGALAEALAKFIADSSLATQMGERSRALAVSRYDVHKVNSAVISALGL